MNKLDRLQKEYEQRLAKQRGNKSNWTAISVKKVEGFTKKHGDYIRGTTKEESYESGN